MDDTQTKLLIEQFSRISDNLTNRLEMLDERMNHQAELDAEKLQALREVVTEVKDQVSDHETRIRAATDGVTSFRVWTGLASGGSGIISLLALIKTFVGF